jgi:hypothetical protein
MRCVNCGCWAEINPNEAFGFVARLEDAQYLILANGPCGTRLVHQCRLRGIPASEHH